MVIKFKMQNYITLFFLLIFSNLSQADEIPTSLNIGIVSSLNEKLQISTTKDSLHGNSILICWTEKNSCTAYQESDFSHVKANDSVEDVETGKRIYSYGFNSSKEQYLKSGIGLAFIFPKGDVEANDVDFNGKQTFTIKKGKVKDVISYCLSSEGVHVLTKLDHIHLYYSLGYAVEANCSQEVYK